MSSSQFSDVHDNYLMIFLKYPEPGKVKTRLAKSIGEQEAADIYRGFVERIIKNTKSSKYKRLLFCDPIEKKNEVVEWIGDDEVYFWQEGECLGRRLTNAFGEAFKTSAKKVVVIGTDNPLINNDIINEAFDCLESGDIVVGPSRDGGYYLIGMKKLASEIFEGIDWSTERVFEQTLKKVEEIGLKAKVMKERFDVDTVEDLQYLIEEFNYQK